MFVSVRLRDVAVGGDLRGWPCYVTDGFSEPVTELESLVAHIRTPDVQQAFGEHGAA
jgi:hypothetical protein